MRIAIVNKFFFLNGGQETVALEQMNLLQQAGHDVAFFAMHHPRNPPGYPWSRYFADYADFSMKGDQPDPFQKLSLAGRFIYNQHAAERFGAFLEAFQPNVVHCHGIAHQLTYAILPEAVKRRIPVVQTLHDYQAICPAYTLLKGDGSLCTDGCSPGNYLPCVQHQCVKNSRMASTLSALEMTVNRGILDYTRHVDRFISPSRFLAEKIIAAGLPPHRMQTIPNCLVGLNKLEPATQHDGYYLYCGRLSHEKGLMTLLNAFRQVPHAKLRIAGEGALKAQLEAYCDTHAMTNVTLTGYLDHNAMQTHIRDAAAVILPSEWNENQPMSIIEAFAHGKPVIASNLGGIPEMVIHGENGLLFSAGNANALAGHIRHLETHPEQLSQLGKQARAHALSHYGADRHLQRLLELYESLTASMQTVSQHATLLRPVNAAR